LKKNGYPVMNQIIPLPEHESGTVEFITIGQKGALV